MHGYLHEQASTDGSSYKPSPFSFDWLFLSQFFYLDSSRLF